MDKHVESFRKEEVTIKDVLKINEDDIKEMCQVCGVHLYGKRFRLIQKIRSLKRHVMSSS